MRLKLLLVDDHQIVRQGLRTLLEKESDLEVVAEAEDGRTAVRLISVFSVLTAREREVLQLLAEGKSTNLIAGNLRVDVKTIETHRQQIMDKLRIHHVSRTDQVRHAGKA